MNIDLDEVRPDRFVIHNDKVRPLLRGEGVASGKFFELVTWRRDGLVARIRARGFNVRTIADRIAALPSLEMVMPPGEMGVRVLAAKERIATFDPDTLRWREVEAATVDGQLVARLRAGAALRRRRSRGAGDFYIATLAHGEINLLPVGESTALTHAYAQLTATRDVVLRYSDAGESILIPAEQALLPPPHRAILELLAADKAPAWTLAPDTVPLAEAVFAALGIGLAPQP